MTLLVINGVYWPMVVVSEESGSLRILVGFKLQIFHDFQ